MASAELTLIPASTNFSGVHTYIHFTELTRTSMDSVISRTSFIKQFNLYIYIYKTIDFDKK